MKSSAKKKATTKVATGSLSACALKKYLPVLLLAAEKKTIIPVLAQFMLSGGKVIASNLDLFITLDGALTGDIKTCVWARKFGDFINLTDGDLKLSVADDDGIKTTVSSGATVVTFSSLDAKNFPVVPAPANPWVHINAADFLCLVRRARRTINKEESRYTLNGALLQLSNNNVRLISTDGHRLSLCEMDNADTVTPKKQALISSVALHAISLAISSDEVEKVLFSADDVYNYFRIGPLTVADKKLIGQFPNFEAVLKSKGKETVIQVSAKAMEDALKLARLFSDERSGCVRLTVDGDGARIESRDIGTGEFSQIVPAIIIGERKFSIGFNVQFLLDFFLGIEGDAELSFKDSATMGAFQQKGKDDFTYVLMPMRM